MAAPQRSPKAVAISAAEAIRRYWRKREDAHKFCKPEVSVHPGTYAIVSNMKNGYPPLVGAQA